MSNIRFRRPDDWHVHLRDGAILEAVAPFTAEHFARAVIMPNLSPPVTERRMAAAYRERILSALPASPSFTPLMTCYLTEETSPADLIQGFRENIFFAAKLYPAGATTNAARGVRRMEALFPVLEAMTEAGMPLLVHAEAVDQDIDIFDREAVFIDKILTPALARFPGLRMTLEHVTTCEGVAFVRSHKGRVGATITPQHLLYDRNALFEDGLRPHLFCRPVLKRARHREALLEVAVNGEYPFFLGTDSAPHLKRDKENACGCAGVFSAPSAISAYLSIFAQKNRLTYFETFAAINGARFYGLPLNEERVTYVRTERSSLARIAVGADKIICFSEDFSHWEKSP